MHYVFEQQWYVCVMLSVENLPGFCSMAVSFCGHLNGVRLDLSFIIACCILSDQLCGRDLGVCPVHILKAVRKSLLYIFAQFCLDLSNLCMLTLSALPHMMLILSGEVGTEKVAV